METRAAQQPLKVTHEQLGVTPGAEHEGPLDFDLGNLMASSPAPVDPSIPLAGQATPIVQSLVAQLFQLHSEAAPVGRAARLPPPRTPLPRQKPLPKPREPTKWEKFAQQKGIQKKKRSVKVWDEERQEWRRRFGYQRAGDTNDVPILEARPGDEGGEDPFSRTAKEKRDRVKATEKRQIKNVKATLKTAGPGAPLPPTLKLAASLPEHGKGKPAKRKEMQDDIKQASLQAGVSTASMGKFDRRLEGEKEGERRLGSKRRKYDSVSDPAKEENARVGGLVEKILRERADDILDVDRAVTKLEHQKRTERRVEKTAALEAEDGVHVKKRGKIDPRKAKGAGRGRAGGRGGRSGGGSRGGRAGGRGGKSGGGSGGGLRGRAAGRGGGRGGGRGKGRSGGKR